MSEYTATVVPRDVGALGHSKTSIFVVECNHVSNPRLYLCPSRTMCHVALICLIRRRENHLGVGFPASWTIACCQDIGVHEGVGFYHI